MCRRKGYSVTFLKCFPCSDIKHCFASSRNRLAFIRIQNTFSYFKKRTSPNRPSFERIRFCNTVECNVQMFFLNVNVCGNTSWEEYGFPIMVTAVKVYSRVVQLFFSRTKNIFSVLPKGQETPLGKICKTNSQLSLYLINIYSEILRLYAHIYL